MTDIDTPADDIIVYPCQMTVKVMGKNTQHFEKAIADIFKKEKVDPIEPIKKTASRQQKYLSLSITVQAESKEQMDALYVAITDHPDVILAL
jgi:uncharacterized protein